MMTEKERRAALNDESNYFYTRRFPYRDGDPVKITVFEFYGLRIYRMDIFTMRFNYIFTMRFNWDSEHQPSREFRFYFTDGKDGTIEIISKTEVLARMKEAEKAEKEGVKR